MSKFINTQNRVVIDSLVEGFKESIRNNPYYMHNDKKATITTYFNVNLKKSTLDESLRINYSNLGEDSPLRYNKINNSYLYGIERVTTDLDLGDYGISAGDIEGEAIILPNTIIPYPQDYFYINYLNKEYLFKVLSVTNDTLEDGGNFYKITYKLNRIETEKIEKLVVEEFEMMLNNTGTNFVSVVRSTEYKFIENIDTVLDKLKQYYKMLFYNKRVQTFTFRGITDIYDPYMIEFMIRNNIMLDYDDFLYISHNTFLPDTFGIDYDKTIFRRVELKDKKKCINNFSLRFIDEPLSILSSRTEQYFQVILNPLGLIDIETIEYELLDKIENNRLFYENDYRNIIIKYFNDIDITSDDIDALENVDYRHCKELFYYIPIIIFCLESTVKTILNKKE